MSEQNTSPGRQSSNENVWIIIATLIQGVVAAIGLIEYITQRGSRLFGSSTIDQLILGGSLLALLITVPLYYFRRNRLANRVRLITIAVIMLGAASVLIYAGIWVGKNRYETRVVATGLEELPFLKLRNFSFEGSLEGWKTSTTIAPTNISVENNAAEAYDGSGYLRLRTELPGTIPGTRIHVTQTLSIMYAEPKVLNLVEGAVAYIKIMPSEQTIDNKFEAEFQVLAFEGETSYWSKSRYQVTPGKWTPVVWTRPTWITAGDREQVFTGELASIYLMIWAEKPYVGQILVDDIQLFMIQRP